MKSDSDSKLLSSGEAAEELGIPPYTLQYLLSTGTLPEPELRLAGKRVWCPGEIEKARRILQRKEESRGDTQATEET